MRRFLEQAGTGTRLERDSRGAPRGGGMEGGVGVIFIAYVLWLATEPCLNIVM